MEKEKYFCRNCKGIRNHKELHKVEKKGSEDDGYFQWFNSFSIVECLGCETISFLEIYGNTEMYTQVSEDELEYHFNNTIFPHYLEKGSELDNIHFIPERIRNIYEETIAVLKVGSLILAAGGLRAIIEAICNDLKIKKGNLAERIDLLYKQGKLTLNESKRLHSIRFLGNDALHEIEKPLKEHIFILFDIVNHLLANLYINDNKLKGKVETVIDEYDEFLKLVRNKINKDLVGKSIPINQLLGKSQRLISKGKFKEFEKNLTKDLKAGKHSFLSIESEKDITTYKIEKMPGFVFDWTVKSK